MTERQRLIIDKAASLNGCGYIMGATGWKCTQARIEAQAKQYTAYADSIRKYGPKWIGKACYDCAQLTKAAAKAAGITLPSGATSQYKADVYDGGGLIATIPRNEVVQVWREEKNKPGTMAHTGIYMGDGTTMEARGHAYGCVRRALSAGTWTHWKRFRGISDSENGTAAPPLVDAGDYVQTPDDPIPPRMKELARLVRLTVPHMRGDDVELIQQFLLAHDMRCLPVHSADGVYGAETCAAVHAFQRRAFPDRPGEWDGIVGPNTWAALTTTEVVPDAGMV